MTPPSSTASETFGTGPSERPAWRRVAMPSEHGGWGLTLEPPLLALMIAPSPAGVAIGLAGLLAFLARTPSKLVLVDLSRRRWLPRTRRAAVVSSIEALLIVVLAVAALVLAGGSWIYPVLAGLPLLAIELWYDARSRGRRLIPELCGAIGIGATGAAIVVAGDEPWQLGVAIWAILAGRALVSIPFVRAQIVRLRRGVPMSKSAGALQVGGVAVAFAAAAADRSVLVGAVGVAAIAVAQAVTLRRPVPPPKILGLRQLGFGLALVGATAMGVILIG